MTSALNVFFFGYAQWLSLLGALMCLAVMFIINWYTALITFAIIFAIWLFVRHRKLDINWGSSTQAHVYKLVKRFVLSFDVTLKSQETSSFIYLFPSLLFAPIFLFVAFAFSIKIIF